MTLKHAFPDDLIGSLVISALEDEHTHYPLVIPGENRSGMEC